MGEKIEVIKVLFMSAAATRCCPSSKLIPPFKILQLISNLDVIPTTPFCEEPAAVEHFDCRTTDAGLR
jgi:hypothetical protein